METHYWESVAERRSCSWSWLDFPIFERDIELLKHMQVAVWSQTFALPLPTESFHWRQFNRMLFRNERILYKRLCTETGESIISIYAPEYQWAVCTQKYRWSDDWNPLEYGQKIDFTQTFNEQFKTLYDAVPKMATSIQESENCTYTNSTGDSKDCYMSFRCHYCSDTLYSYRPNRSSSCVDCFQVKNCERLYECIECNDCQMSMYLKNCSWCFNSKFLIDCEWCHDCFMCCNLANASYCISNKKYTKEEYEKIMSTLKVLTHEQLKSLVHKWNLLESKTMYASVSQLKCESCIGSSLVECADCFMTFMMKWCVWSRWAWDNVNYKSSMDNYSWGDSELCYTTSATKKSYRTNFTLRVKNCTNVLYSMFCFDCNECFWCVWLRNKEFCIFNTQYTKDEYAQLVAKLITHMQETHEWWRFFDPCVSAFPINDTVAYESFPLYEAILPDWRNVSLDPRGQGKILLSGTEKIVSAKLDVWRKQFETLRRTKETEVNIPEHADILRWTELPESILEVDDDILEKIIVCSVSWRPYRIVPQELQFYREWWIPLPRIHPDMRHQARSKHMSARELFLRTTTDGKEILSVFPDTIEKHIVAPEKYTKIVYW